MTNQLDAVGRAAAGQGDVQLLLPIIESNRTVTAFTMPRVKHWSALVGSQVVAGRFVPRSKPR